MEGIENDVITAHEYRVDEQSLPRDWTAGKIIYLMIKQSTTIQANDNSCCHIENERSQIKLEAAKRLSDTKHLSPHV